MRANRTLMLLLAAALGTGCNHRPVYPETGSLIVTTNPPNAAIYVDGAFAGQRTPAKLDGVPTGSRNVSLKLSGFKSYQAAVDIRPGETRRMNATLTVIRPRQTAKVTLPVSGLDMAYDPLRNRLYLSHRYVSWAGVYQIMDSTVALVGQIEVGMSQGKLACHAGLGRLAVNVLDTVKLADLDTWQATGWAVPAPGVRFHRLVFSPDGRALLAADSAGRRVLVLDPQSGGLVRSMGLPGCVNDLAVEPGSRWFYATLTDVERFVRVDLESGAVLDEMATGPTPGTVFQDDDGEFAGFCNVFGRSFVPVRVASWTRIETPLLPNPTPLPEGDYIWGACFSTNRENFWIFRAAGMTIGSPAPLPEGHIFLFNRATWNGFFNMALGQYPERMVQSRDGRYLYIMEYYDLLVLRTDTE